MRLVLDTNVVTSGLPWNGAPAQLIEAAQADDIELFCSRILLAELTRILLRAKFAKAIAASGSTLEELVPGYAELVSLVTPTEIPPTIQRDPTTIMSCHAPLLRTRSGSSQAIMTCSISKRFEGYRSSRRRKPCSSLPGRNPLRITHQFIRNHLGLLEHGFGGQ